MERRLEQQPAVVEIAPLLRDNQSTSQMINPQKWLHSREYAASEWNNSLSIHYYRIVIGNRDQWTGDTRAVESNEAI